MPQGNVRNHLLRHSSLKGTEKQIRNLVIVSARDFLGQAGSRTRPKAPISL